MRESCINKREGQVSLQWNFAVRETCTEWCSLQSGFCFVLTLCLHPGVFLQCVICWGCMRVGAFKKYFYFRSVRWKQLSAQNKPWNISKYLQFDANNGICSLNWFLTFFSSVDLVDICTVVHHGGEFLFHMMNDSGRLVNQVFIP